MHVVDAGQVPVLTPQEALALMEAAQAGRNSHMVWFHLPKLARAAFAAGDLAKARVYAEKALAGPEPGQWAWRGEAIYEGNQVLARIVLREGDVAGAKAYLAASGKTPGAAVIDSFGPNMLLARELLELGQRDAVIAFLEDCRVFWEFGGPHIDAWEASIRSGQMPDFGNWLRR